MSDQDDNKGLRDQPKETARDHASSQGEFDAHEKESPIDTLSPNVRVDYRDLRDDPENRMKAIPLAEGLLPERRVISPASSKDISPEYTDRVNIPDAARGSDPELGHSQRETIDSYFQGRGNEFETLEATPVISMPLEESQVVSDFPEDPTHDRDDSGAGQPLNLGDIPVTGPGVYLQHGSAVRPEPFVEEDYGGLNESLDEPTPLPQNLKGLIDEDNTVGPEEKVDSSGLEPEEGDFEPSNLKGRYVMVHDEEPQLPEGYTLLSAKTKRKAESIDDLKARGSLLVYEPTSQVRDIDDADELEDLLNPPKKYQDQNSGRGAGDDEKQPRGKKMSNNGKTLEGKVGGLKLAVAGAALFAAGVGIGYAQWGRGQPTKDVSAYQAEFDKKYNALQDKYKKTYSENLELKDKNGQLKIRLDNDLSQRIEEGIRRDNFPMVKKAVQDYLKITEDVDTEVNGSQMYRLSTGKSDEKGIKYFEDNFQNFFK